MRAQARVARTFRRAWWPAMTAARSAARPITVRLTPAPVRDQVGLAILAIRGALLRRPRHRRRALHPSPAAPRAAPEAAGQRRQEGAFAKPDNALAAKRDGEKKLRCGLSVSPSPYLLTAALLPLSSFRSSEPAPSQLSITSLPFSITSVSGMILSSIFV